jgi:hypothetical protein
VEGGGRILDRGGWTLGAGAETGVPMAIPRVGNTEAKLEKLAALELGGAVGEGALPDEEAEARSMEKAIDQANRNHAKKTAQVNKTKRQSTHPKPVTTRKKPVTGKLEK